MSFLVDPPLLVAAAAAIEALGPEDASVRRLAHAGLVATFVGFSVGLYLEARPTSWLWKLVGARSGRDWMLNSRVTDFPYEHPSRRTHVTAALLFLTYPAWAHLGRRLGARHR